MSPRKRQRSRGPSPQHRRLRLRPQFPQSPSSSEAIDASANSQSNTHITSDELIQRLERIRGPTPCCITITVTDYDNQLLYAIDAREDVGNLLWVLKISTMTWEHIHITHHAANAFREDQEEFPYRKNPNLGLWGPVDHRRLLLFGGKNTCGKSTTDFFSIDLTTKIWMRVLIEGGAPQDYEDTFTIFKDDTLCLFGLNEQEDRPNTFSIAEVDNSTGIWIWKHVGKALPPALQNIFDISAAPLSRGKTMLLVGCSVKRKEIKADKVFTFDLSDYTFVLEDAAGKPPHSMTGFIIEPAYDKIIFSVGEKTPKGYMHYNWVYAAHPFNIWKRVTPLGPFKFLESYGVAILGGKLCALLGDNRKGGYGLNSYIELDDLIEDVRN